MSVLKALYKCPVLIFILISNVCLCATHTVTHFKLEDGLCHPSVDVDAFATTYMNLGVTLTFTF